MSKKFVKYVSAAALASTSMFAQAHHMMSAVNMMDCHLILIDVDSDMMIMKSLRELAGFPDAICQHSWITPDRKKVFISTDGNANTGTKIVALRLDNVDFHNMTGDVTLESVIPVGVAGTLSSIAVPTQESPLQPIPPVPSAWFPTYSQLHGPTLLPGSPFSYLTGYTDSNVYVLNNTTNQVVRTTNFGAAGKQMHGISFNASGTYGLSAPYQFDRSKVNIFTANKTTGAVSQVGAIQLGTKDKHAAFVHFVSWADDRYAYVGTMQADRTSFTATDTKIIGPSVWRIDATLKTAKKILGPTNSINGSGVYRPASDVAVVGNTLIVAEEDTLDGNVGPGYIAFFDITDPAAPTLIKRMVPGVELPADFKVAHVISVVDNKQFAYVSSYYSNHIIKIDLNSRNVTKVFSEADGLHMPHGEFISGNTR
jgi:hypothetical protein